jgi:hypothetical protein
MQRLISWSLTADSGKSQLTEPSTEPISGIRVDTNDAHYCCSADLLRSFFKMGRSASIRGMVTTAVTIPTIQFGNLTSGRCFSFRERLEPSPVGQSLVIAEC